MTRKPPRNRIATVLALALATVVCSSACGKAIQASTADTGSSPTARLADTASVARSRTADAGGVSSPAPSAPAVTTQATPPAPAPSPAHAGPPKPKILQSPIPFGPGRKAEMAAYARRHYGIDTYRLIDPHVIVIHYTETPDFSSTYNTFAPDVPDSELHELPGTCAHFVIDRAGVIHQLVPLSIMCRHTVGLNWTAIGIEHVGYSDGEVLGDHREMAASLALTRWLRCRFHIATANVIGHNESLSSPYHHENVPAWRTQTHSDFNKADMQIYRARLRALGGC